MRPKRGVDDSAQRKTEVALLNTAKEWLETQQGLIINNPKLVFCSIEKFRNTFGLGKKAGFTPGDFGVAISPRGWKEFYVIHELIHFCQADNFGSMVLLNGEPWLIEGMAYALSNDSRKELHEPFETYLQKFSKWHHLNKDNPLRESVVEVLENGI